MATRAYILIEVDVGRLQDVTGELRKLPAVETVDPVTGPYDLIAVVSAPSLNDVGDLVSNELHNTPGIARTITCLSVGAT